MSQRKDGGGPEAEPGRAQAREFERGDVVLGRCVVDRCLRREHGTSAQQHRCTNERRPLAADEMGRDAHEAVRDARAAAAAAAAAADDSAATAAQDGAQAALSPLRRPIGSAAGSSVALITAHAYQQ